ncbi:Uncharacterised protein [Bifidobacterium bifidum]|nr:Uncharacterised protein [Bifidobacterium bifidum]
MRFSIPGDFNPRSPDGERPCSVPARSHSTLFQSTLPGWGATYSSVPAVSGTVFQSTLPGWGATRVGVTADAIQVEFQSTLPGWGATQFAPSCAPLPAIFQSTLPGWGATSCPRPPCAWWTHFNPRSPDGERPGFTDAMKANVLFQSTLPGWGATAWRRVRWRRRIISIHAPRMGSDMAHVRRRRISWRISIHAPRMGSDDKLLAPIPPDSISIHAPRMGSDVIQSGQYVSMF